METRTFKRNICFSFFESYLEQAEEIRNMCGDETCAEFLISLIRYALYQEEPTNPNIRIFLLGLKNTIDAGQDKRARGFSNEDIVKTTEIIEYKKEHPEATQREIAEKCDCSLGKVNKVLNNNSNDNGNNISNLNSMNVNVNAHTVKNQKRFLDELRTEELEELKNDYRKRVDYPVLYSKYNLAYNTLSKELPKDIDLIISSRKKEELKQTINKSCEDNPEKVKKLSEIFQCDSNDIPMYLIESGVNLDTMLLYTEKHDLISRDYYENKRDLELGYSSYLEWVKMIVHGNTI